MSHSGCNGGKKWQVIINEKYSGHIVTVFDSAKVVKNKWANSEDVKVHGGFVRPQKATDLQEEWLVDQDTFDYEAHSLFVGAKFFSWKQIGKGLRKIGHVLNEPLVYQEEKKL